MSQFIDQVQIEIKSGDGGNGLVGWRKEKYEPMGGPFGGNGGRGGHVYLQANKDMTTLLDFRYKHLYEALPGNKGGMKKQAGKDGKDLIIKVPLGTVVRDVETGKVIADLTEPDQLVMVAEGGRGGFGNAELATATRRAPHFCEPGQPGIQRTLDLELKLLADVAIIGLPNAGKSTLLSVLTRAKPKIAGYPFTTLEPNLGVAKGTDGSGYVIADIPGLIEGASQGVGLGHKFLRHIERTRLLLHLVDIASETLEKDIATINAELHLYKDKLDLLPQILVLSKTDQLLEEEQESIKKAIEAGLDSLFAGKPVNKKVLLLSSATHEGLAQLQDLVSQELSRIPMPVLNEPIEEDEAAVSHPQEGYEIERRKHVFYVSGDRINRILATINLRSPESLFHFHQQLRAMGVIDQLIEMGVQPGSEVVMAGTTFSFGEDW